MLSEAVHQLKPGQILQQGEQHWFSLEDLGVLLLVSQDDQEATPKHRRIVALINGAIEELGRPPEPNRKP